MVGTQLKAVWLRIKDTLYRPSEPSQYTMPPTQEKSEQESLEQKYSGKVNNVEDIAKKAVSPYPVKEIKMEPNKNIILVVPEKPEDTDRIIQQVNTGPYNKDFQAENGINPTEWLYYDRGILTDSCLNS